jgi:hypothetical protein
MNHLYQCALAQRMPGLLRRPAQQGRCKQLQGFQFPVVDIVPLVLGKAIYKEGAIAKTVGQQ